MKNQGVNLKTVLIKKKKKNYFKILQHLYKIYRGTEGTSCIPNIFFI